MLTYTDLPAEKKAFLFELDNVLFPRRDYFLQVYYLFANIVEYLDGFPPAAEVVEFCKNHYDHHGDSGLFDKLIQVFNMDEKYRENLDRLYREAKLPLKLLLFSDMLKLLQDIVVDRKSIFVVTSGDPEMQLNKIRQTEWNGLEDYLKVFFTDEVEAKPSPEIIEIVMEQSGFSASDMLLVGHGETDRLFAQNAGIDFVELKF
jgi:phosphoglycolate phosphatase-like HAD superfamily hydrolase